MEIIWNIKVANLGNSFQIEPILKNCLSIFLALKVEGKPNYWLQKWKIAKLFCGLFCQFLQNCFKEAKIRRALLQEVAKQSAE